MEIRNLTKKVKDEHVVYECMYEVWCREKRWGEIERQIENKVISLGKD